MKKSIIGFLCWLLINLLLVVYLITLFWSLFHPESKLHTFYLIFTIFVTGTLLSILITAGAYIVYQCPKINDLVWHGLDNNGIKMDIREINKRISTEKCIKN
jgi:hypothetical protein